jgi:hypothetical protein
MSVARLVVLQSLNGCSEKSIFRCSTHTGVGGVSLQKNRRVLVFLSYFTRKREGVGGVCACLTDR